MYSQTYNAATWSMNRQWMTILAEDSKKTITPLARRTLLSHARRQIANVGKIKGANDAIARYTVGAGFDPVSSVSGPEGDDMEEYFRTWSRVADLTGKNSLTDLLKIYTKSVVVDGDIGVILTRNDQDEPRIQSVEGHHIGEGEGKDTIDGVKFDRNGAPISYRVIEEGNKQRDVPASAFALLYMPDRCDQGRGVSAYAHAINNIQDELEILGHEKAAVKLNAALAVIIKGGNPDARKAFFGNTQTTEQTVGTDQTTLTTEKILGSGAIPRIDTNEDIWSHTSDRPSAAFAGFLEFLVRDVAVGLGLPYEFVWDASKVNGTSQRFILKAAERRFEEFQQMLKGRLLDRLWFYVVGDAINRGILPPVKGWSKVDWQNKSAMITVDVGRESREDRADVLAGLRSRRTHFAEQGKDYAREADQIEMEADDLLKRAKKLQDKHGVTLELAIALLEQQTANNNFPQNGGGKSGDSKGANQ